MRKKRPSVVKSYKPVPNVKSEEQRYVNPFIACGKVFNPVLPFELSQDDRPVPLTRVSITVKSSLPTNVLINFSCFITSALREAGAFNNLVFRLVRECSSMKVPLREYSFQRQLPSPTDIKEPLVYNFCDENPPMRTCTYTLFLVKANVSKSSFYDITNKSMTGLVFPAPIKREDERI
ncbi:DUF4489 domain-containing protein [Alkalihalobacillus sp. CinArs1]|uniref:DUF4489 domain-containing protein n=1 Tax=Alkalihalobacillus sp. CinArs1 TaxID=2995314 RepID=UPI0022DDCA12|nr:DUF4489 domain-containing protein [Alkalihalobacillus sp. CinArs1]